MATLAGIPTAPSIVNPVASPEAATIRRTHVLGRMLELHYITPAEFEAARQQPDGIPAARAVDRGGCALRRRNGAQRDAGQVRRQHLHRGLPGVHHHRFAPRSRRAPWRCAPACWNTIAATAGAARPRRSICRRPPRHANLDAELEEFPVVGGLRPAIVQKVEAKSARIYVKGLGAVKLPWEKLSWARRELPDEKMDRAPAQASEILSRGDVIYTVGNSPESLQFVQVPEAQSALVAVDPKDGAVVALVGGFDYLPEQVQSGHPGAAPARFGVQAVRVCGGVRQGLHAGQRRPGCAHRDR